MSSADTYVKILSNYLHFFSEVAKDFQNRDYTCWVGANAITHIFKLSMLYSQNTEIVTHKCQTAYYCYLEYIQQIRISNQLSELNEKDAVLFIYNKTLSDFPKTVGNTVDTNITKISTLIMNWKNRKITIEDRHRICVVDLPQIIRLNFVTEYLPILECIQEKYTEMDADQYSEILKTFVKYVTKHGKPLTEDIEDTCFYVRASEWSWNEAKKKIFR